MVYDGFSAVGDSVDILGESPIWSARENAIYWVDIRGQQIRRHLMASGKTQSWNMPSTVGSIGLCDDGRVLVALKDMLALFDPATGALKDVANPGFADAGLRFNDGRVDRQGRFWVGSMHDKTRAPVGQLFRMDANYQLVPVVDGIRCPNSLCWSPDGRVMYFADTDARTIFSYSFDPLTGTVGPAMHFAEIAAPGGPDGCVVDAEGFLWCAIYGVGKVIRFNPQGGVDREIIVPVSQPTSCAFGGENGTSLFITTASQRLSPEALAAQPLAGRLLVMETGIKGIAEPLFITGGTQ